MTCHKSTSQPEHARTLHKLALNLRTPDVPEHTEEALSRQTEAAAYLRKRLPSTVDLDDDAMYDDIVSYIW